MYKKKHEFLYESQFKPLHQSKYSGALIDNIADAPILVLEDKDIRRNINMRHALKCLFGGLCTVTYVYKITPCK